MNKEQLVIKTENLTRKYGKNIGVKNLNLQVKKGEIFGFLGPNGAGKTTTVNLLLNLIRPTSGKAFVFGLDTTKHSNRIKKRTGFLPGDIGFYEDMRGIDYLKFFARLKGVRDEGRIKQLADHFFKVPLRRKISQYSSGMKQILGIIQAFISSPDLYILDESTANLDPVMSRKFYQLIRSENKKGKTVLLCSHQLGEVEKLCHRVGIIKNGSTVATETIENIRKKMTGVIEVSFSEQVDPGDLKTEGVDEVIASEGSYQLKVSGDLNRVFSQLSQFPIKTFDYHKMSLEEIFLEYFQE